MTARELLDFIDKISPFAAQEEWDNSGLALDNSGPLSCVIAALDIDDALVRAAPENACILLHHPLIFRGLKTLAAGHEARLLLQLAAKNCALIAAHTSFDKSHLNRYFAESVLGLRVLAEEGFVIFCEGEFCSARELAAHVGEKIGESVRYVPAANGMDEWGGGAGGGAGGAGGVVGGAAGAGGGGAEEKLPVTPIWPPGGCEGFCAERPIAVCCGSGASMAPQIYGRARAFITGDVKFHDATAARLNGLNLIDAGHFGSEKFFAECVQNALKDLPIEVRVGTFFNPFVEI